MLALLLLTLLAPARSFAQRDLALLHDSLQRIDNPDVLRGMIAQRSDKRAQRSPEVLTEKGLIGLRLYEITSSRPDGKGAQQAFEDALRTAPEYGWANFGLGKVLAHGPDSDPYAGGLRNAFVLDDAVKRVFGKDATSRARNAFLKAVNGTPPVPDAAAELAELSTRRWSQETLERSATALAELNQTHKASADSWLAYARVQLELGSVDAAVTSLENAVKLGVNRAQGARTLAMVLFQSQRMEKQGSAAWFESVDHADDAVLGLLFDDIVALLNKQEIARWEKLTVEEKRTALRTFWDMRAALAGIPVHERLAEHYRRLQIARRQYWRSARFGAPKGDQLQLRSFADRPYDDRGTIFIRHGQPAQLLRSGVSQEPPMESWLYHNIDGQPRMLHFAAMQSLSDYDLVHMLPCDAEYIDPRRGNDPNLRRVMGCDALSVMAASANYRQQAFEFLRTDTDAPNFTKDLPFYFDLYTFRGEQGRTNVVAAVAVPVEKLQKTEAATIRRIASIFR